MSCLFASVKLLTVDSKVVGPGLPDAKKYANLVYIFNGSSLFYTVSPDIKLVPLTIPRPMELVEKGGF